MTEPQTRSGNKRGHNKGIAKAKKERKRAEAEARNALTPPERRRAHRNTLTVVDGKTATVYTGIKLG